MIYIDGGRCKGCGNCLEVCPPGAITLVSGVANIDQGRCTGCETCVQACPEGAILVVTEMGEEGAVLPSVSPISSITLRKPISPSLSVGKKAVPLVVSALALVGREIAPRFLLYLADILNREGSQSSALASPPRAASGEKGDGGSRFRRRRGGKSRWKS